MKNIYNNFLLKIEFLSGKRNISPWLTSLGISVAGAGRIKAGDSPSVDLLSALSKTERVSLRWIDEERGSPYVVSRVVNDDEAIALLTDFLHEDDNEDWAVLLASNNDQTFCVILYQEKDYERKGKTVVYKDVEVIAGGVTLKTFKWLRSHSRGLWIIKLTDDEMIRLSTGYMGNMELFGWEDARKQSVGVVSRKEPSAGLTGRIKSTIHGSHYIGVEDDETGEIDLTEVSPEEYDEKKFLAYYHELSNQQKVALLDRLKTLVKDESIHQAGQLKLSEQDTTPLNELYVLLDVCRYLEPMAYAQLMETARNLAAQQLANEYENHNQATAREKLN